MSSIFSDPPFLRGTTLLNGDTIETDANGPVAGRDIVGSVKVFIDQNPVTAVKNSNRLVYCVAARYKGSDVSDASTVAGEIYLFDTAAPMREFTSKATATTLTAGLAYGVLDEYLTGPIRTNDIVWLVLKGPVAIKQTAVAINAGVAVQASATAGSMAVLSTGVAIGTQIAGAASAASAVLTRVNLHNSQI